MTQSGERGALRLLADVDESPLKLLRPFATAVLPSIRASASGS